MRNQCILLSISRSSVNYTPVPESDEDREIKRLLDEIYLIDPTLGSRRLVTVLARDYGRKGNRKRVRRLRQEMGQESIWCRPRTTIANKEHRKYPYLLRGLKIERPDQVWCADITCVPMPRGHAYLCAVMDWYSRKVLAWTLSNTMDTEFCLRTLEKAIVNTGQTPEIFNTDQGCQFTSLEWTGRLDELGVKISMDGRGRWMDKVFIERLWRSVKYEEIYLHEHATISALDRGLERLFAASAVSPRSVPRHPIDHFPPGPRRDQPPDRPSRPPGAAEAWLGGPPTAVTPGHITLIPASAVGSIARRTAAPNPPPRTPI